MSDATPPASETGRDFIRTMIDRDIESQKYEGRVVTRFPPEPNGFLHIGHAKAICLNFLLAQEYPNARCHLRFDDTNPETEDTRFVDAIRNDIQWLGFDWKEHLYFTSNYFDKLFEYAVRLIKDGKAYVDSLSDEAIREYRGTVSEPGKPSPFRSRSVDENLDLFERMRAGEFDDGSHVLRAIIDLSSPNMKMRDPLLYRVRKATHHRTGDKWPIYPMYDFAHCLSDAIEGITHSLCTLEFENNRELYDWILVQTGWKSPPSQTEYARLNISHMLTSKRKVAALIHGKSVDGWDDPRAPTLAGLRRRGYTPEAIRTMCEQVGIAKANSTVDIQLLEHFIRDDLNHRAPRVMAVVKPLKVVITNYPDDHEEELDASYWPHDVPKTGTRKVPFTKELFIEQDDFQENPPKKFFRLAPGKEVRLRYAYIIKCEEVVKDDSGNVVEVRCTYDETSRGGNPADGRKVKGTIHWVSAKHGVRSELRLYDRLFSLAQPEDDTTNGFLKHVNPKSLVTVTDAVVEPSLAKAAGGEHFQFERQGYFFTDPKDSKPGRPIFNLTVPLKDAWAKVAEPSKGPGDKADTPKPTQSVKKSQPQKATAPRELSSEAQALSSSLQERHKLARKDADTLAIRPDVAAFFEHTLQHHANAKSVSNLIINELMRELKERSLQDLPFGPTEFAQLVALSDQETISKTAAKEVFAEMLKSGDNPLQVVKAKGLEQISDEGQINDAVAAAIAEHPTELEKFKGGNAKMMGFFVGKTMKRMNGKANPKIVNKCVQARLAEL